METDGANYPTAIPRLRCVCVLSQGNSRALAAAPGVRIAVVLAVALLGSGLRQLSRLGKPSPYGSQSIMELTL